MMNTTLDSIKAISLERYVQHLNSEKVKTYKDKDEFYWRKNEIGVVTRIPTFELHVPSSKDIINDLLFSSRSLFAGYILSSGKQLPVNAYWYHCNDQLYSIDKLHSTTRRHIRRSLKRLKFECVSWPTLKEYGFPAFRDTRQRTGLSDGTIDVFQSRFSVFLQNPGHHILGAWKDDTIIAFMTLVVVDDWVELGGFSTNEGLTHRPNNGLAHVALEHFLKKRNFKEVSYGLSSIQEESNAGGLHAFKLKCGFSATPIHRCFSYNFVLSPFINSYTLKLIRLILIIFPKNRWLKKGSGMLSWLIEERVNLPIH